jgi:excisionase family DNA binding protein
MQQVTKLVQEVMPIIESWMRHTINDEVAKALEADRRKRQPAKQYTRQEVARLLHVSLPTLWQFVKDGKITATHVGRRVLFDEAEVKRFLNR